MKQSISSTLWLNGLLLMIAFLSACAAGEGVETCTRTGDCTAVGHICYQNECIPRDSARECTSENDCLSNESCVSGFCGILSGDVISDVSENNVADTSVDPNNITPDTVSDDTTTADTTAEDTTAEDTTEEDVLDMVSPSVVDFSPKEDERSVSLDAVVTLTFSEPILEGTINDDSFLFIWDYSTNGKLPISISWDEATLTATLTPDQPLLPLSPYRVELSSNVVDLAGLGAFPKSWEFSTRSVGPSAFHEEIARAYAPVFHQDLDDAGKDIPLRIDFDGNMNPLDNGANLGAGSADPAAYYLVSETETHYFIHYVLYYPTHQRTSADTVKDHSSNAVLVVARKTADRLGELQIVQTYSSTDERLDTFYPDCGGAGAGESFCNEPLVPKSNTFKKHILPPSTFTIPGDERRVPIYSQGSAHHICHFEERSGNSGYCGRSGADYIGTTYVVLDLHAAGETPSAPSFNTNSGTYALHPLAEIWWTQRASVGDQAEDFYLDMTVFPSEGEFLIGSTQSIALPSSLNTPVDGRSNNSGRISPFAWNAQGTGDGRWMVDPANTITRLIETPTSFAFFASKYCYNLFVGIDRSAEPACIPPN